MFQRTWSMSNAVCFKHDNNVCACAVSALILLPVVDLSPEMNSTTSISYMTWKVLPFDAAFVYFGDFSLRMRSSGHITISSLKSDIIFNYWLQRTHFTIKSPLLRARDTVFGDCDDNICGCAVGTLILLPVVNFSPKMDSATAISCMT